MICIYCFHEKTTVTNSRSHKKDSLIWRRRQCPVCHRIFTTIETPLLSETYKITNEISNKNTPFSHSRLTSSLLKAFGHMNGQDGLYRIVDDLSDTIEKIMIKSAYYGALSSDELGVIVHDVLKKYDASAALQYAAQHRLIEPTSKRRRGRPSVT